jgi:hypothetical protein
MGYENPLLKLPAMRQVMGAARPTNAARWRP